jgi:hypothetical protein
MSHTQKQEGLRFGCLTASLIPILHFGVFWGAVWVLLPERMPSTWDGWLGAVFGGVGALLLYPLTFLFLIPVMALLSLKDRDASGFLERNWPFVIAVTYPVWGGWIAAGPFDEIIVGGLGLLLELWFIGARLRHARHLGAGLPAEQQQRLVDVAQRKAHLLPSGGSIVERKEP